MIADRWLAVDKIAVCLGVKRDTLYKWINQKQLPSQELGQLWKIRKDELDQWVLAGYLGGNKEYQG